MPKISLDQAAALIRPRDTVACGLAGGQPIGILEALGQRRDLEEVQLFSGLLMRPYAFLAGRAVRVMSGFFGPVERAARAAGAAVEYVAADFHGLERLAFRLRPRVVLAAVTPPDADGWMSFGLHAGATFRPFLDAARDPERLAIAEANPCLPRVAGLPEHGGHRVHVSQVDAWVEHESEPVALPDMAPTSEELAIAGHVVAHVESGATLQFGIGGVPDEVARILAESDLDDLGVHTEMIGDGVMRLHAAGKVTNRKGLYDGVTVATFALGSAALYRWLDGNADVRLLPVGLVNEPSLLRQLRRFVSINAALAVDLTGQVVADRVGPRQHSGVGGHESFVTGAGEAPGGQSFVCLESTATVGGRRISRITARLPDGATVTTPRHHVQWVVTEYGAVDLSGLGDEGRARALIGLAHPDFRAALEAEAARDRTSA